jgi:hypothetical protein
LEYLIEDFIEFYLVRKEIFIKSILHVLQKEFDPSLDYPLSIILNATESQSLKVQDVHKFSEVKDIFSGIRNKREKRTEGTRGVESDNSHRLALLSFISGVWDFAFPQIDHKIDNNVVVNIDYHITILT